MSKARKEVIDLAVDLIQQFTPGKKENAEYLRGRLESMSNEQFDKYMEDLGSGQEILPLYVPNLSKTKLTLENNMEVAKRWGHNFFERIWYTDIHTGVQTLSFAPAMVVDLPVRMQAQLLEKKDSIPLDNSKIDEMSGQVTGEDKGSKMSFPEIQSLASEGLDLTILELIKVRGGDRAALAEMERQVMQTGESNMDSLLQLGTRVKSTEVLSNLLYGMHFDNNF